MVERTDFYIVYTRGGKIKAVFAATQNHREKAEKIVKNNGGRILRGTQVLSDEDIDPTDNQFLILVGGQLKDQLADYDEAQENARTYEAALKAMDTSESVQIVQVKQEQAKRKVPRTPLEEFDDLNLRRFHVDRNKQANCEFCHPTYPAQPYQDFNYSPIAAAI